MSVWNRVAAMEKARLQRNGGYRVWFAPGTAPKTGVALVVSNRLAGAKVEVLYRDLTGHTLIATLHILGRLSLLLVISHAPPTSDAARAAYFKDLLRHIPPPDPAHPDRVSMWMGERDTAHHMPPELAAKLEPHVVFSEGSFDRALDAIKKGTMPGLSGVTVDLVANKSWRKNMIAHLSRLACKCFQQGTLTESMRVALISVLYKGKGLPRDLCTSYRPVSLTDATCRIIDKAIQIALNEVAHTVLCGLNNAFLPGRRIETDALSLAEVARYSHTEGEGGAIVYLDADKAYDRAIIPFLRRVLRAMRFPETFIRIIDMMYTNNFARLTVTSR